MYTKLISPEKHGKNAYNNKGSSRQVANYLDKEERKKLEQLQTQSQENRQENKQERGEGVQAKYSNFFSDQSLNLDKESAIQYLDKQSENTPADKERFFSFTYNFSPEESNWIEKQKDSRALLKKLVDQYTDEYAKSFNYKNKSFQGKDVSYIAKIHDFRTDREGKLKTEGQLHVHVEIARMDKSGKNELNPETRYKDKFNKTDFFDKVQSITEKASGIKATKKLQNFHYLKLKTGNIIEDQKSAKHSFRNAIGYSVPLDQVNAQLSNNRLGLKKSANSFTHIEIETQSRLKYYLQDPAHQKQLVDNAMSNYAQSLKKENIQKEDLLYFYRLKKDEKGKDVLEVMVSNRDQSQSFGTTAHPNNFDIQNFKDLNNQNLGSIIKNKEHVSPLYGQLYRLKKNTGIDISYEQLAGNQFIKADHQMAYNAKQLNNYLGKDTKGFVKKDIEEMLIGKKEIPNRVKDRTPVPVNFNKKLSSSLNELAFFSVMNEQINRKAEQEEKEQEQNYNKGRGMEL